MPITADGKFELTSVPRLGEIQIIAVCDGWVSKTEITIPKAKDFFVLGKVFDASGTQVDVTLDMEQTGTLELSILSPDGRPLESGVVSSGPNQLFNNGECYLGQQFWSIKKVRNQLVPIDQQTPAFDEEPNLPFYKQPIVNGITVLRGLPVGLMDEECVLHHDDYQFPDNANGREGRLLYKFDSAEPKKVTITVVPRSKVAKETP